MRRFIKKELLISIKKLEKANEIFQNQIETEETGLLKEILTDFQQSAIQIGSRIENFEGEGTEAVTLLEQYCEAVYQLSEYLQNRQKANRQIKRIKKLLSEISTSIEYSIPYSKKEIVFLPYKASMWDSLESVWSAAKEDPDCEVFVIPIPYYDKNPDGMLTQMHYEGKEYPDYVTVTSWEEYSIAERTPDIVYIHNPYDNYNKVTSIHPAFYAKELKKYTDMLVYIPYFITLDYVPKHFCVLPGTMYSDKIIVQSEIVRDTYIREFRKFEEENNCIGMFGKIEEKFLSLGSPKFDKVSDIQKENMELPENWKKLILKPDGTRKKVLFYNTTVQAILDFNEKYLDKLQEVLEIFCEKQNDITLLWRPHPLSGTTIASMRPWLLEKYNAIVNEYKKKAYGIYDDTADMYRAIAVSDAYYGDWSSVVVLYRNIGKPYMIQNVEVRKE